MFCPDYNYPLVTLVVTKEETQGSWSGEKEEENMENDCGEKKTEFLDDDFFGKI